MIVNQEKCIGCGQCKPYCPVGAIAIRNRKAVIDLDECVDCISCMKANVCPVDALSMPTSQWPRELREQYSNPRCKHPATNMGGRGTEEVKTNDVTAACSAEKIGLRSKWPPRHRHEISRSEKMSMALAPIGIDWELANPLTTLFDPKTGVFRPDVLNEKSSPAFLEFFVPLEKLEPVLLTIRRSLLSWTPCSVWTSSPHSRPTVRFPAWIPSGAWLLPEAERQVQHRTGPPAVRARRGRKTLKNFYKSSKEKKFMSHTLHRQGSYESLSHDFPSFQGRERDQQGGSQPMLREFVKVAFRHHPVKSGQPQREHAFRYRTADLRQNHRRARQQCRV
jgi:Fe-S-cluster-containing hydrogenase component 2